MPTIDLPDNELRAVIAALRQTIADDKFPHELHHGHAGRRVAKPSLTFRLPPDVGEAKLLGGAG